MFIALKNLNLLPLYCNIILIALESENGNKTDVFLLSWLGSFNFLSFIRSHSDLILPTDCGCRGLLLPLITLSDTYTFDRTFWTTDQSVAETSLPANTQHSQERQTSIPPAGFESASLPTYIYIYTRTYIHTVYQIPEAVERSKLYCVKEQ